MSLTLVMGSLDGMGSKIIEHDLKAEVQGTDDEPETPTGSP